MPLTNNADRDAAATRAFAQERARVGAEDSYWRGGGDYYFELTPEGIKVTGGDTTGNLQGGASTILRWDDPGSSGVIDAILAEQGTQDTEFGVRYEPTEPAPQRIQMEPMQITGRPTGAPEGEATVMASKTSQDTPSEGEPTREEGLRAVPVRGAPDPQFWTPPSTPEAKQRALAAAERQGVAVGDVQFDERRPMMVYDWETGTMKAAEQGQTFRDRPPAKHKSGVDPRK